MHRGQSLIEVVIALSLFALLVVALASAGSGVGSVFGKGDDIVRASLLADEALEAVRSVRDGAWNELAYSSAVLSLSGNAWQLASGASVPIGPYTRSITFSDVCRNVAGDQAACPPTGSDYLDVHSKRVSAALSWQGKTLSRSALLTDWDSNTWMQTDWSGGSGQTTWASSARYASDDGGVDRTTAGEIKLTTSAAGLFLYTPSPTTRILQDVSVVAANDVWAVGLSGTILHYDGSSWSVVSSPTTSDLYAIDMISGTAGWAVGANGTILRYSGGSWTSFSSPTSRQLNDVQMLSATDGFAVGHSGAILRFNGSAWSAMTSGTTRNLFGVYALSSTNARAVGNNGTIRRFNGTSWVAETSPVTTALYEVVFVSPTDGWAVGANGRILRYTGSWALASSPVGNDLQDIIMVDASNGWIVGNAGRVLRYNGTSWSIVTSPSSANMNGIDALSMTSGWIVGASGVLVRIGGTYVSSGSLISSAFPLGDVSPVETIEWDESVPVCTPACSVRAQIQVAPDAGGSPGAWSLWTGPDGIDGDETDYFTVARGTVIPVSVNGARWVRYQLLLDGDGNTSPIVSEMRITYR